MKTLKTLLLCAVIAVSASSCSNSETSYSIKDGKIVYPTPERPAGQQSMLGYADEPLDTVRVGFIGLGMRGPGAVKRFTYIDGVSVKALCDLYPGKFERSQQYLAAAGMAPADEYVGPDAWKQVCERDDINLIYICTNWQTHVEMAVYAMEHGKHVAIEVPAATSIKECWDLVNTSERTRRHCMMLENCVYDFFELTVLNMAQQGLFGEIIHAEGAYLHCLDPWWERYQDSWRMEFNRTHRGDVYPTHGLGPVCQVLNIHRGDRMKTLVSMDTDAFKGKADAKRLLGADDYANGDNTSTLIRTEKGKTILIEHGVVTPRPYSRMYQITGTEGMASKYPQQSLAVNTSNVTIENQEFELDDLDAEKFVSTEVRNALMEEYKHPIVSQKGFTDTARKVGGHGGMDFIMDYRLVYCLRNGLPLDMDVYDAAEWSCMTELSGVSCEHGSMPVEIPDFTRGEWDKISGTNFALVAD